jgi:hypothetical protein
VQIVGGMRQALTSVTPERTLFFTSFVLLSYASVLWLEDAPATHKTNAVFGVDGGGFANDGGDGNGGRVVGGVKLMSADYAAASAVSGSQGDDRVSPPPTRHHGNDLTCDVVNRYVFVKT